MVTSSTNLPPHTTAVPSILCEGGLGRPKFGTSSKTVDRRRKNRLRMNPSARHPSEIVKIEKATAKELVNIKRLCNIYTLRRFVASGREG